MNNALTTDQSRPGVTSNQQNQNITKPSLRSAINTKCRECIYCPLTGNGTWRQQTAACTSKTCPVWPVRPRPYSASTPVLIALEKPELGHNAPVSDIAGMGL